MGNADVGKVGRAHLTLLLLLDTAGLALASGGLLLRHSSGAVAFRAVSTPAGRETINCTQDELRDAARWRKAHGRKKKSFGVARCGGHDAWAGYCGGPKQSCDRASSQRNDQENEEITHLRTDAERRQRQGKKTGELACRGRCTAQVSSELQELYNVVADARDREGAPT